MQAQAGAKAAPPIQLSPKAVEVTADQLAAKVQNREALFVTDAASTAAVLAKSPQRGNVKLVPVVIDAADLNGGDLKALVLKQLKAAGCDTDAVKPNDSLWAAMHRKGSDAEVWTKDNYRASPVIIVKNATKLTGAKAEALNALLDVGYSRIPEAVVSSPTASKEFDMTSPGRARVLLEVGTNPFTAPAVFSSLPKAHLESVVKPATGWK